MQKGILLINGIKKLTNDNTVNEIRDHEIQEKISSGGKYTSITSKKVFESSDEVVAVYHKVSKIEGIVSL